MTNTRIDFSRFSKVQDRLKSKLMMQYQQKQMMRELSDEELDMVVAAAGQPNNEDPTSVNRHKPL